MVMFRSILCSVVILALGAGFMVANQEKGEKIDKKGKEAKITKLDGKKHTATVTIKSKDDDKGVSKTFKLAEDIEYVDSDGKAGTIEIFTSGDMVFIIEIEGTISKMTKKEKSETKKTPGGR
jgi:hypothetical protein